MKLRNSNKFKKEFGARSFSSRKLPLYSDVGKHYLNILNRCKKSAISDTMDSLIEIWVSASLPVCGKNSTFRKLQRYINHINTLSKFIDQVLFSEKCRIHFAKFNILFDISSCKCDVLEVCRCPREFRIPVAEREFMVDQRGSRNMNIDMACTSTTIQSRHQDLTTTTDIHSTRLYIYKYAVKYCKVSYTYDDYYINYI